jgi:hypothetical protein
VFAFHLRVIRADRVVTAAAPVMEAAPAVFTYVVRVPAATANAARARLAAALPDAQVTPADAASGEGDGGPSIVAVAGSLIGVLLLLFVVLGFFRGSFFGAQEPSAPAARALPASRPIWVATVTDGSFPTATTGGAYIRSEGALTFNFKESGQAKVTFPEFAPPFMVVAVFSSTPNSDGTLVWRVGGAGERALGVRLDVKNAMVDVVSGPSGELNETVGKSASIHQIAQQPVEIAVLVRPQAYVVFIDGQPAIEVFDARVDTTPSALSMTATGTTGMIALLELRVHEAP